ncbi:hypothetical protein [Pseudoalteromonas sp. McH1-42]|uniref:hypothetical protein n=1 Tax=Pseudoalteromonas sp. McH1-42 TaxID=2917752 RepID=UPI001EF4774E|nr:hypothetical protein [Pseudoalteromonas sp. McH1-42]MCG7560119.1 hypothetical protein [Pseudoalteromonas sp. McH1-42]
MVEGQWRDSSTVNEQGQFSITKLPANTEVLVKVSSAKEAFLTRYFAVNTPSSSITRETTYDLLDLEVSAGYTKEFTVLESGTGDILKALSIWSADIVVDEGIQSQSIPRDAYLERMTKEYGQKAVFNEDKGVYQISLAKDLPSALYYQADINEDKIADYRPEFTSYDTDADSMILVSADNVRDTDTFHLEPVEQQAYTLALTVLDRNGNVIEVDRVVAQGNDMGAQFATLNADTGQYELDAKYFGDLTLQIPGFVRGDVAFSSATVHISDLNEHNESYRINANGSDITVDLVDNTLNLVVKVFDSLVEETSVVLVQSKAMHTAEDYAELYFNVPVAVEASSIKLKKNQDIAISSENGITTVDAKPITVAANTSTDLNNTRLRITPETTLDVGSSYSIELSEIQNLASGKTENIYYRPGFTLVHSGSDFEPESIVADNNNYLENDQLILTKNSAVEESQHYRPYSSVDLYLPINFSNVEYFGIQLTGYTRDGEEYEHNRDMSIIENGEMVTWNAVEVVRTHQLANNEHISYTYHYTEIKAGTTLANGNYIRVWTNVALNDNTADTTNEVSFTYKLQLKGDKTIKTGTMTLPVR